MTIKTSDGNGADTELRETEAISRGGAKDISTRQDIGATRLEVIALRFDLTNIDRANVANAQLQVTSNRVGIPASNGLAVHGLNANIAGQNWVEGTNNTPWNVGNPFPGVTYDGNLATSPLNAAETTPLGSVTWTVAPDQGDVISFGSAGLNTFLQNSTGLTTLFLNRNSLTETQIRLASKETVTLGTTGSGPPVGTGVYAPQLVFDVLPVEWINPAGGSFQTGGNWIRGAPPTPLSQTVFNLPGAYTVTLGANVTNRELMIGNGAVALDLQSNQYLVSSNVAASGGGALTIANGVFDFQGILQANNGSSIAYAPTALTPKNVSGVLAGGSWRAISTGGGATVTLRGADVTEIGTAAEVVLHGSGSVIQVGSAPLESTLATNRGALRLQNGRSFVMSGALNNVGILELDSQVSDASLTAPTVNNTGIIRGKGKLVGIVANSGRVAPGFSPGTIQIEGDFMQTSDGSLQIEVGGLTAGSQHDQLQITGAATLGGRLEVPIINGFVPVATNEIQFLTAGSVNGKFSSILSPNLSIDSPTLAIDVLYGAADVKLRFAPISTAIQFDSQIAASNWSDEDTWTTDTVPGTTNAIDLQNLTGTPQRVEVASEDAAFTHQLLVSGNTSTITVAIENDASLSAISGVTVGAQGVVELGGGSLVTPTIQIQGGGELSGNGVVVGDVFVGAGPGVEPATVRPGLGNVGGLSVEGDYVQLEAGALALEIDGGAGQVDTINVDGAALLGGKLTVEVPTDNSVQAGDVFTVMNAGSLAEGEIFDEVVSTGNPNLVAAPIYRTGTAPEALSANLSSVTLAIASAFPGFDLGVYDKGDMNRDFAVTPDDVSAFTLALRDPRQYEDQFFISGDVIGNIDNNSRGLDFDDIDEFAALMNMSVVQLIALMNVPEPANAVLALWTAAGLLTGRRRLSSHCR